MIAATTTPVADHEPARRPESAVHFYLREGQAALRISVIGLAALTLVTMVTFYFWAIIPATLLLLAYSALLFTNALEQHTERGATDVPAGASMPLAPDQVVHDVEPADGEDDRIVSMPLLRHEVIVVAAGVAAILILATALAVLFFGGIMMLLAIPFLAAYMILLGGPVWLAAIEDDIEAETQRQHRGPVAEHPASA